MKASPTSPLNPEHHACVHWIEGPPHKVNPTALDYLRYCKAKTAPPPVQTRLKKWRPKLKITIPPGCSGKIDVEVLDEFEWR